MAQVQSLQAHRGRRLEWACCALGLVAVTVASIASAGAARAAASQCWPAFVLVTGLLLIGVAADDDHLFAAAGRRLASGAPNGIVLYAGAVLLIGCVTALLNLDTSVAFLTPVLIYAARNRGTPADPLLYGSVLLANASSLFLPGSNLTNVIVLGHLHLTGGQFLARTWAAALTSMVVSAVVLGVAERRALAVRDLPAADTERPVIGLSLVAIASASVLVVVLRDAAVPVVAIGIAVTVIRVTQGRERVSRVVTLLGLPLLIGLLGVAIALGTLGRTWAVPTTMLSHLDPWATSAVAALLSVLVNNLPAASLLAARMPPHPVPLLIGLNVGPNLFCTGSLAWFLWLRAARSAGESPSVSRATRLGLVAAPLAMAGALIALVLTGQG